MIWIISDSLIESKGELDLRHETICKITKTTVSDWTEHKYKTSLFSRSGKYYKCTSRRGEYGLVITAHCDEIIPILTANLSRKKALIIINSCLIKKNRVQDYIKVAKTYNNNSEIFFAKQEVTIKGDFVNYYDNLGTFGYKTTRSERSLFRKRKEGLVKAIRSAFEKVQ